MLNVIILSVIMLNVVASQIRLQGVYSTGNRNGSICVNSPKVPKTSKVTLPGVDNFSLKNLAKVRKLILV